MTETKTFDKERDYVVFFTPEAGVAPHFVAQCVLARTLKDLGYKVAMARCSGILPRCPVMDMHVLPPDCSNTTDGIEAACGPCKNISSELCKHFELPTFDLAQLLPESLLQKIEAIIESANGDPEKIELDGIKFGIGAARDVVLATKRANLRVIDDATRTGWFNYARTALYSYVALQILSTGLSIGRLVYFNEYAVAGGAIMAARRLGIPTRCITFPAHRGSDRRRVVISSDAILYVVTRIFALWPDWKDVPLGPQMLRELADDVMSTMSAQSLHVYSPAKTFEVQDLRETLGLRRDKKTIAAFTSTIDEMEARRAGLTFFGYEDCSCPQPFGNQVEWLTALCDYVEAREDLQLVIRVHPREGVTRRDRTESEHLGRLKAALDKPYRNCRIVWPEEKISSYDIIEIIDLGLTAWSTLGLEMSRLAIPVMTSYQKLSAPSDDFMVFGGETPEMYFKTLDRLLVHSPTIDSVLGAFRCSVLAQYLAYCVDIRDVVPTPDFFGLPDYKLPKEASSIEMAIVTGPEAIEITRERLLREALGRPSGADVGILKEQLKRLVHFFLTGETVDPDAQARLTLFAYDGRPDTEVIAVLHGFQASKANRAIVKRDGYVYYSDGGGLILRYSVMLARLASVCADAVQTPALGLTPTVGNLDAATAV